MTADFELTALRPEYGVTGFDCGHASLDRWLRDSALRAQHQGSARVWVMTAPGDVRVLGYFATAPTTVERVDLSGRQAGGLTLVPVFLIGKLAVDRSVQGRGLGANLLRKALENVCAAAAAGGGRIVVVDAIDERAAGFYAKYGFTPIRGSRRLVMLVADIEGALGRSRR